MFEHNIYIILFYYRKKWSYLKLKVYDNAYISTEELFTQFVCSFKMFANLKLYVDYHKMQSTENLLLIYKYNFFFFLLNLILIFNFFFNFLFVILPNYT